MKFEDRQRLKWLERDKKVSVMAKLKGEWILDPPPEDSEPPEDTLEDILEYAIAQAVQELT